MSNSNSISTEHPEAHAALVIIEAMREQARPLAVLGLHTARLSRHFKETLKQLNDAQEKRLAIEATQLREAAALCQMDQKQGLPYNPSEDGFVFQPRKSRPSSAAKPASKQPLHVGQVSNLRDAFQAALAGLPKAPYSRRQSSPL